MRQLFLKNLFIFLVTPRYQAWFPLPKIQDHLSKKTIRPRKPKDQVSLIKHFNIKENSPRSRPLRIIMTIHRLVYQAKPTRRSQQLPKTVRDLPIVIAR